MNVVKLTEDQAVKDQAYPIEVKVYSAGVQVKPTAASIVIKDPDGDEALASTAMTVGSTGTLTYSLASSKTDELWENAVMEIIYTISTVVYRATFLFDVVLNALVCDVTDDDLKAYFPQLADEIWSGVTNYSGQIAEAFREVKRLIKDKGRRPAMIIDGSQVRELVIIKTFEMIFFNFAKDPEGIWWKRHEKYVALFTQRFAGLVISYDEDESGSIDSDEKGRNMAQVTFIR
ncbi:MAG: hypothetical protein ACYDH3_00275 [Candidatus Aminicenantales bacterium]